MAQTVSLVNPLSPSSDQHPISPDKITAWSKHSGNENKEVITKSALILKQILPTTAVVWEVYVFGWQ